MAIRKIPFVLCIVASLLVVNLAANAAFPGPGEIPDPPGLRDNPNIPDFGDIPDPLGHDGNPAPFFGDIFNPPGLGHSPPGPSDFAPTGFESQTLGSDFVTYTANPEPATLGLLILGGLALLRRRP